MSNSKEKELLVNAAKLAGEAFVFPGSSLLAEKKIKSGLLHAGAGLLANYFVGGYASLIVSANSFSLSSTNKNLLEHLLSKADSRAQNLIDRVKQEVAEGFSLNDIKESVFEDVEDLYAETKGLVS